MQFLAYLGKPIQSWSVRRPLSVVRRLLTMVARFYSFSHMSFLYDNYDTYGQYLPAHQKAGHCDLFCVKYGQKLVKNWSFLALFQVFGGTFLQH